MIVLKLSTPVLEHMKAHALQFLVCLHNSLIAKRKISLTIDMFIVTVLECLMNSEANIQGLKEKRRVND